VVPADRVVGAVGGSPDLGAEAVAFADGPRCQTQVGDQATARLSMQAAWPTRRWASVDSSSGVN
jgi:hypothetical protein